MPVATDEDAYAFDNALAIQRDRLRALETLLDPGTIRHLEALEVQRGWQCLEAGAGGGSIARWLCDRVGPEGSVLATDLDTTLLLDPARPDLHVRVHDVLRDDLPEQEFDLIHARLLLAWLGEPAAALARLVAALKPGGRLLCEEMDFASLVPDPRLDPESRACFERVVAAHTTVLAERNAFDHAYGRRLTRDVADAGLADVGSEGRVSMWHGGQAGGRVYQLTFAQLRAPMLASGLVTEADVDGAIALCDDPRLSVMSQVVMAAWGRRRE